MSKTARLAGADWLRAHIPSGRPAGGLRTLLLSFTFALLLPAILPAQTPASPASSPSRVVFVCEHGSVKSLVAASYFNLRAEARGLPYVAVARGTMPESTVPAPVREGLKSAGFDVSAYVPQRLSSKDIDGAVLIVSFDQDIDRLVDGKASHWKWDNMPGVLADYNRGRNRIVERVEALIERLSRGDRP